MKRTLAILAALALLFVLGPTLFLGAQSLAGSTGLYVDISMMPKPEDLFEKACGHRPEPVELNAWMNTDTCPKE